MITVHFEWEFGFGLWVDNMYPFSVTFPLFVHIKSHAHEAVKIMFINYQ